MPRADPLQGDFSAGEISPRFYGRADSPRYAASLKTCLNYIPTLQGSLSRRPATQFISEAAASVSNVKLVPFVFSSDQAYMIEVNSNGSLRFYKNKGLILDGASPYTVSHPYTASELPDIKYAQSGDVMYWVHPNRPIYKLIRFSDTDWSFLPLEPQTSFAELSDGPYLPQNDRGYTISGSTGSGTITISTGGVGTVSNIVDNGSGECRVTMSLASGAPLFYTGDRFIVAGVTGTTGANGSFLIRKISSTTVDLVGSTFNAAYTSGGSVTPGIWSNLNYRQLIRAWDGSAWSWAVLDTGSTSSSTISAVVKGGTFPTSFVSQFRLGLFYGYGVPGTDDASFPSDVTFHENRLMFFGARAGPQQIVSSQTGDYENFAPTEDDGTVVSSNGLDFVLATGRFDGLNWAVSDEKGLLLGSPAGERVMRSASTTEALSATSVDVRPSSAYGSKNIKAVVSSKAALFVQAAGKKILELNYFFDVDGFRPTDLSYTADHLAENGFKEIAFQKSPIPLLWCLKEDGGKLKGFASMTYERDIEALRVGWARHQLGGKGDAAGNSPTIDSIAVIPAEDNSYEEVWMAVQRYVDGSPVCYIEVLTNMFEDISDQKDAFFVDSGLSLDSPIDISSITKADPGVVTATSHGLSDGDQVRFYDVEGMTELNGNVYTVANVTANTFEITDSEGNDIDTSNFTSHVSGSGVVRELVTTISGLDHLEGETVSICADGQEQPSKTVSSGEITLEKPAAVVHAGLGYNSDMQLLPLEAGSRTGTALGKIRRINECGFYLHRSLHLKVGPSFDNLTTLQFTQGGDEMNEAPPLFSGIKQTELDMDYDFENTVCVRQDKPLPSTILAVLPKQVTQDS